MITTKTPISRRANLPRVLLAGGAAALALTFLGGGVALADNKKQKIDQDADVRNKGKAKADSGDNVAIGNNSSNKAKSKQEAKAKGGKKSDNDASNDAKVSNDSDGKAKIRTGDSNAKNHFETRIKQRANNRR